jgi:HAMP domain-containing protein
MAGEQKIRTGLLFRLILGIFIPILLAFVFMACILFLDINIGKFRFPSIKGIWANSLNELGAANLKESTNSLNKLGEEIIRQKAEDVGIQLEIYLGSKGYPNKIPIQRLYDDPVMKKLSLQKIGETGYTAIHDTKGINHFHANPKLIGSDLHNLASTLPAFWKILEAGLSGEPVSGYYDWKEPNGTIRSKYMVTVPVRGTNLIVAATTYIDEFSQPARAISGKIGELQKFYSTEYNKRFGLLLFILVIVVLVLFAVVYAYSYSVVSPIRHLSEVADKISMGDMNVKVDVKAKGEIGLLAESIERMQTSVKAAIERLQKRR